MTHEWMMHERMCFEAFMHIVVHASMTRLVVHRLTCHTCVLLLTQPPCGGNSTRRLPPSRMPFTASAAAFGRDSGSPSLRTSISSFKTRFYLRFRVH